MGSAVATVEQTKFANLCRPLPKQKEYWRATDRYLFTLFGGARGPGKSYAERWRHVRFLLNLQGRGMKGVRTAIFCTTYKEARKRQFLPAKAEFPEWLGTFNESNLEFTFAKEYGSHSLAFLNLEDPSQYKSDQFATIGIEELTLCPNPLEIIDVLSGSLRWPGVEWSPMGFTSNPDGPGHSQVKGLFVTGDLFAHPDLKTKNPKDWHFVRALPHDNPHLPDRYIEEVLEGLPPSLREPWLLGSWDLFEGQRFEINPAAHVCKPLTFDMPIKWYCAMDYGFDNPFAALFFAVLPTGERPQVYLVREEVHRGLKARDQARMVLQTIEDMGIELAAPVYLDTACWKEDDDGLSIAQKLQQEGLPVQQVLKDRATGWVAVEDMLAYQTEDGVVSREPRLKMFSSCPITVQQLTDAQWDPKKPGDILHPEGFRDDALDSLRYYCLTHYGAPKRDAPVDRFAHHKNVWKAIEKASRRR